MTPEQEQHVTQINTDTSKETYAKFAHGAREHGGDLRDMSLTNLIRNGLDENIDQNVYMRTALAKAIALEEENKELKAQIALYQDVNIPQLEKETFPPKMKQVS